MPIQVEEDQGGCPHNHGTWGPLHPVVFTSPSNISWATTGYLQLLAQSVSSLSKENWRQSPGAKKSLRSTEWSGKTHRPPARFIRKDPSGHSLKAETCSGNIKEGSLPTRSPAGQPGESHGSLTGPLMETNTGLRVWNLWRSDEPRGN